MSYACYLAGVQMPTPAKLTVKIKNKNKTLILLNEGEINFLRTPGLTEIVVPFVFPMLTGRSPDYYLGTLERLKTSKEPTQFILVRSSPSGGKLFDTNIKVSVEDYNIVEDVKANGLDVAVDVSLKQWRDYGTKTATVEQPAEPSQAPTVTVEQEREASTAPAAKTYTVKKGDTLWAIAAKYYGKGSEYSKIAGANTDKISNPNLIYPGQVLTLP